MPNTSTSDRPLHELVVSLHEADENGLITVQTILRQIGEQSYAAALLVPAMILVSPLSGIMFLPTFGALVMGLIAAQGVLGRPHLWLPEILLRRQISAARYHKAIDMLERPVDWFESHARTRLVPLVRFPFARLPFLATALICLIIPLLELLPMVTSIAAFAISLMSLGLIMRDGLFVLLGYLMIGAFAATLFALLS